MCRELKSKGLDQRTLQIIQPVEGIDPQDFENIFNTVTDLDIGYPGLQTFYRFDKLTIWSLAWYQVNILLA